MQSYVSAAGSGVGSAKDAVSNHLQSGTNAAGEVFNSAAEV